MSRVPVSTYSRIRARPKPALAWCLVGISEQCMTECCARAPFDDPHDWPGAFTAHPVLFGVSIA